MNEKNTPKSETKIIYIKEGRTNTLPPKVPTNLKPTKPSTDKKNKTT